MLQALLYHFSMDMGMDSVHTVVRSAVPMSVSFRCEAGKLISGWCG